jgi:hypothetical protein
VAGETKTVKSKDAEAAPLSSRSGSVSEADAGAAQPDLFPREHTLSQLREPFIYYVEGLAHKLPAAHIMSSADYDLEKLMSLGAQLDAIDPDTHEVLCDMNELE